MTITVCSRPAILGGTYFRVGRTFKIVYGNSLFNLRWNHIFSDKIFSNLSVIYNDYYYGMEFTDFAWDSGIKTLTSSMTLIISCRIRLT